MVVTPSREHAVRLYQAIRSHIEERGLTDYGTLVAFSGTVKIDDIEYTEPKLNGFADKELPDRFGYVRADDPSAPTVPKREYRILVVAEKYQTSFDQPLLTTMYVDKPAWTKSRLGTWTSVLDPAGFFRTMPVLL
ncbi:hypothetical protein ACLMAL_35540 [Nocardia sp. CWNU-33]|uniref:hypothetical protein n=1 Tax=Nocardia sp. CWNU-33 TaxID=3392117 RepID=UPI00398EB324